MSAQPAQCPLVWRKSHASADQGACVEIAFSRSSVLVRDSRNPVGPILIVAAGHWHALLEQIKSNKLTDLLG
jgi:hypothetical protein